MLLFFINTFFFPSIHAELLYGKKVKLPVCELLTMCCHCVRLSYFYMTFTQNTGFVSEAVAQWGWAQGRCSSTSWSQSVPFPQILAEPV